MVRLYLLVGICVVSVFALGSEACQTHDQPCEGGGLGGCCGGLVCHKACPNWEQGRCYHQGKTMPGCPSSGVGIISSPSPHDDDDGPL